MLTARQVAEYYDHDINRSGYIACPFHSERTPSLKVYDEVEKGFCCFGCQVSGSVIDFVMHIYGLSFTAACVKLVSDFNLDVVVPGRPGMREIAAAREVAREKKLKRDRFELEYLLNTYEYRRRWKAYIFDAPVTIGDAISDAYAEACKRIPVLDQWFEDHPYRGDRY